MEQKTRERFVIEGGCHLRGEIRVQGAKNSALPILAATVLCRDVCVLQNVPDLRDVDTAVEILAHLGARIGRGAEQITVDTRGVKAWDVPCELMGKMRSSVFFLGPIVGAVGRCDMTYPGGCELGPRPIDLHLQALRTLGVSFREEGNRIHARMECPRAGEVRLCFPSVGATENAMLTAVTVPGTSRIVNAAREPEIKDLADFLNACGASVSGAGSSVIEIRGGRPLHGTEYRVMPDRMAAATWMCAAAATGGDVFLRQGRGEHLLPVQDALSRTGCAIRQDAEGIRVKAPPRLRGGLVIRTAPYPGFPTDAQAPLTAALCKSDGISLLIENIFDSRFGHAAELRRMGASVRIEGRSAVISGVPRLRGACVRAGDLRGGAALLIAGMAAEGQTVVSDIFHIDRGYQNVVQLLNMAGVSIERVSRDV